MGKNSPPMDLAGRWYVDLGGAHLGRVLQCATRRVGVEPHLDGDQEAVIQDRTESGDGGSAQSTGKVDPQAPGWTKRVRVGSHPSYRTPSPNRVGAQEQTRRGYAQKLGEHVVETALGLTFDSLAEAYGFCNLYSYEHGFGIRYDKSRLNGKCREDQKCMQEIVCGCSEYLACYCKILCCSYRKQF